MLIFCKSSEDVLHTRAEKVKWLQVQFFSWDPFAFLQVSDFWLIQHAIWLNDIHQVRSTYQKIAACTDTTATNRMFVTFYFANFSIYIFGLITKLSMCTLLERKLNFVIFFFKIAVFAHNCLCQNKCYD